MTRRLSFTYDRGGVPVELTSEAEWAHAIKRRHISRDSVLTVFGEGLAPRVLRAENVPELRAAFDRLDPRPEPTRELREASPTREAPPISAAPPTPQKAAASAGRGPWHELGAADDRPPPPRGPAPRSPADPHPLIPPRPAAAAGEGRSGWSWPALAGTAAIAAVIFVAALGGDETSRPVEVNGSANIANAADAAPTPEPQPKAAIYRTSFECGRSSEAAEALICGSESLAAQDRNLAKLYAARLAEAPRSARAGLKSSQRAWIRRRNGCASEASPEPCLLSRYEEQARYLRAATFEREQETASATSDAAKPARTRIPRPAKEAPGLTCILPNGGEANMPLERCRSLGGVVMN
jgi:uncharacterized protein YecT (DUF1311 family)